MAEVQAKPRTLPFSIVREIAKETWEALREKHPDKPITPWAMLSAQDKNRMVDDTHILLTRPSITVLLDTLVDARITAMNKPVVRIPGPAPGGPRSIG